MCCYICEGLQCIHVPWTVLEGKSTKRSTSHGVRSLILSNKQSFGFLVPRFVAPNIKLPSPPPLAQAHSLCGSPTSLELQYYMRFELHLQPPNKCMSVWALVFKPAWSFCLSGEECCVKTIRCSRTRGSMLRTDNLLHRDRMQPIAKLPPVWSETNTDEWIIMNRGGCCFMMKSKEQTLWRKQSMRCFSLSAALESESNWVEVDNCSLGWWKSGPLAFSLFLTSFTPPFSGKRVYEVKRRHSFDLFWMVCSFSCFNYCEFCFYSRHSKVTTTLKKKNAWGWALFDCGC